jgi:AmmeMemoRadiSam system protein B
METKKRIIREASHAGSWYDSNATILSNSFKTWFGEAADSHLKKTIKGIIGPHAGYVYCGQTASHAYLNINPLNFDKVFLLGPSHHKYIRGCGLPSCNEYETPFGNIKIDTEIVKNLSSVKNFMILKKDEEEKEHSLEMHLPLIKSVFGDNPFTLVPIMVGGIDVTLEDYFGKIFSEYFKDEKTLFIVSSDFCHWGRSFDYEPYNNSEGEIWQYIEKLDKSGINLIEDQNVEKFNEYLELTENTICGRHPIGVYLNTLKYSGLNTKTVLLNYSQSSQVKRRNQSSVSYASIVTYLL